MKNELNDLNDAALAWTEFPMKNERCRSMWHVCSPTLPRGDPRGDANARDLVIVSALEQKVDVISRVVLSAVLKFVSKEYSSRSVFNLRSTYQIKSHVKSISDSTDSEKYFLM